MARTASPEQLEILRQAVDDYCHDCGIIDREGIRRRTGKVRLRFDLGAFTLATCDEGWKTLSDPAAVRPNAICFKRRAS